MDKKEHYIVAKMMIKYGGSFAEALGKALLLADEYNAERIKKAFPELWKQYLGFAKKEK